ncbi:hypothetical protein [Alkalihalobacterium alkalinitrilicum]|uniref:hypothetical protein n=1 Tax=Alkalihalobacterium alkalinitrilicum TaxID=427920 RepID=UPI000994CA6C|nr:hypothetical protein [Alkalihalobacterium alkalinitrilicum]
MKTLKQRFIDETKSKGGLRLLVVAVQLPSGAIETITNTENIVDKVGYYWNAYDDEFRLKVNPDVRIVGYMIV